MDRHQVSPNATASSPASDPSYPMTTRLAMVRLTELPESSTRGIGIGLDIGQIRDVPVVVPQPGV